MELRFSDDPGQTIVRIAGAALLVLLAGGATRADVAVRDDDSRLRDFVERWTGAQNRGDLAAYQALYARSFEGVRRSGPRMVRFDRAGWMRDRARMFRKKMEVAAESLLSSRASGRTTVSFVQHFRSGSYQDVGLKQLVLVDEDGGLRIAREEMLSSERETPGETAAKNAALKEPKPPGDRELCSGTPDGWTVWRAPLDGGQAVWATREEPYRRAIAAVCRDGRLLARLDEPPDPSCGSTFASGRLDHALVGDAVEVRSGAHAFAVYSGDDGEPSFSPKPPRGSCTNDPSDVEGFEPRDACDNLQLYALVDGKLAIIYNDARARWVDPAECARFASALFQCAITRGRSGAQGWYDLEKHCTTYEYGRARSRSNITRLRFEDGAYQ
jgi:hypothetical protein